MNPTPLATMPEPTPDAEQESLRDQIRAELEAEHAVRVERFDQRRRQAREHTRSHKETARRREVEELREQERRAFYQEKGYKQYIDSNGRTEWLPPEEYEWRQKRRRKRDRKGEHRPAILRHQREIVLYGLAVIAAILLGMLLIR